jgi:ElaB/YqjD/DUF883 family membrane-anchored ribosome-binding protein
MTKKKINRIEAMDGVTEQYDSLKADMAQLRDDVTEFFHAVMDAGNSGLKDAQSRIGDELQHRIDTVRERMHALRDRGRDGMSNVQSRIEERPLTSIVIAFAVGWLAGKIFDRS